MCWKHFLEISCYEIGKIRKTWNLRNSFLYERYFEPVLIDLFTFVFFIVFVFGSSVAFGVWQPNNSLLNWHHVLWIQLIGNRDVNNVKLSSLRLTLSVGFKNTNPIDTGRKKNVHKTFRRRPGRFLNVLCTFSLRPGPAGNRRLRVGSRKTDIDLYK